MASSRSIFLLKVFLTSVFLIGVTSAAPTVEVDNKSYFILNQNAPSPLNEFVNVTCGNTTANDTIFTNTEYPQEDTEGGTCDLVVNKYNDSICQMRIDFVAFELAQPDSEGHCSTDFMTVTGASHTIPTLCGSNTGQHIYVDVSEEGCALKIIVDMDTTVQIGRIFNLQITQVPCTSFLHAPEGCLQYFTETSGNVKSFNYPANLTEAANNIDNSVTRQISNTYYSACVRPEDGYSSITWTPDPEFFPYSFFVNGLSRVLDDSVYGNQISVTAGSELCIQDYVIVPGGVWVNSTGVSLNADRYCGVAFPNPVTSTDLPFELFVQADGTESPLDGGNIGFSLNYRQSVV